MDNKKLYNIFTNAINGNRRDMVEQIDEYGVYEFWEDFKFYLMETLDQCVHDQLFLTFG